MGWLVDKLEKCEPLAWVATGVGLPIFVREIYTYSTKLDDSVMLEYKRICGVEFSNRNQFRQFKEQVKPSIPFGRRLADTVSKLVRLPVTIIKNFGGIAKSVGRFARSAALFARHPYRSLVALRKTYEVLKADVLTLGFAPFKSLLNQEVWYWIGGTGSEFTAAFVAKRMGDSFPVWLALASVAGFWGAQTRRLFMVWYTKRYLNLYAHPDQAKCEAARNFKPVAVYPVVQSVPSRTSFSYQPHISYGTSQKTIANVAKNAVVGAAGAITILGILEFLSAEAAGIFGAFVPPGVQDKMNTGERDVNRI